MDHYIAVQAAVYVGAGPIPKVHLHFSAFAVGKRSKIRIVGTPGVLCLGPYTVTAHALNDPAALARATMRDTSRAVPLYRAGAFAAA